MPAIITHDQFALQALQLPEASFVQTGRQREAFQLGSQGPDPLFYLAVHPTLHARCKLGGRMHAQASAALIEAMAASVDAAPEGQRDVALAYAAGFVCHYLLDRTAHPFIYAQQYAFCDAGVPGLTRENGSEVHATIESELDELVLYTRTGLTIASYEPQHEILQIGDAALGTVSRQVAFAVRQAYGQQLAEGVFATAVRCFRFVQGVFHSPGGRKREALGRVEELVRPYSFVRAMCHRPLPLSESAFDNREHEAWTCPFTGVRHTESFEDLFGLAQQQAAHWLPQLAAGGLSAEAAHELTEGLNFSGAPAA